MLRLAAGFTLCAFLVIALPRAAKAQSAKGKITQVKAASPGLVEVEITSDREFPVLDSLVTLHIGDKSFTISRSPENGSLNTLIFTVPASDLSAGMSKGSEAWIDFGHANGLRWDLGALNATAIGKKGEGR
jgi:hypothetical protein